MLPEINITMPIIWKQLILFLDFKKRQILTTVQIDGLWRIFIFAFLSRSEDESK